MTRVMTMMTIIILMIIKDTFVRVRNALNIKCKCFQLVNAIRSTVVCREHSVCLYQISRFKKVEQLLLQIIYNHYLCLSS